MQLYLTTNHVISHISDGVSGLIFIVTVFLTINIFDIYAIPIAMIIAYLGFYSWYAAYYSYKSLCLSFFKFEMKTTIVPLTIFILFTILNFFYNK